jgi:hypothetical protein
MLSLSKHARSFCSRLPTKPDGFRAPTHERSAGRTMDVNRDLDPQPNA